MDTKPSAPLVAAATVVFVAFLAAIVILAVTGNMGETNAVVAAVTTFVGSMVTVYTLHRVNTVPGDTAAKINGGVKAAIEEVVNRCFAAQAAALAGAPGPSPAPPAPLSITPPAPLSITPPAPPVTPPAVLTDPAALAASTTTPPAS